MINLSPSTLVVVLVLSILSLSFGHDDPEIKMDAFQIIQRWGYPAEEHLVSTEDGYLLKVQRIPRGKDDPATGGNSNRPVVFMQHGLEGASTNWLTNLPNESAAYIFADAGFDVWLGNFRGNSYGLGHRKQPYITKDQFWAFSWDEMALRDLPAMIDFALETSGQESLYYIGHSEGTMTPFALLSHEPEFSMKIKRFFALGPVASVGNIREGLIHILAAFQDPIEDLFKIFGVHDFVKQGWWNTLAAKTVCENPWADKEICENLIFQIGGANTNQLNASRVPVYISHCPAGTSVQNIVHFAQGVTKNNFAMYDYGNPLKNLFHYGQITPPEYDLSQIRTPVYLFWGKKDILADEKDIYETIIPNLKTLAGNYEFAEFNHLDFIWGLRAAEEVYDKIIKIIQLEDNLTEIRRPTFSN